MGNTNGKGNKGKTIPSMTGELHPRWNPNKTEFKRYSGRVHWLTRKEYKLHESWLNPSQKPIGRCGVDGAHQVDHKLSIKRAFQLGLRPELVARYHNLQVIPWKANRSKGTS